MFDVCISNSKRQVLMVLAVAAPELKNSGLSQTFQANHRIHRNNSGLNIGKSMGGGGRWKENNSEVPRTYFYISMFKYLNVIHYTPGKGGK